MSIKVNKGQGLTVMFSQSTQYRQRRGVVPTNRNKFLTAF